MCSSIYRGLWTARPRQVSKHNIHRFLPKRTPLPCLRPTTNLHRLCQDLRPTRAKLSPSRPALQMKPFEGYQVAKPVRCKKQENSLIPSCSSTSFLKGDSDLLTRQRPRTSRSMATSRKLITFWRGVWGYASVSCWFFLVIGEYYPYVLQHIVFLYSLLTPP